MSKQKGIGIAVILLGITVIAILAILAVNALEDRADLEAVQLEMVALMDKMAETDESLATLTADNSLLIADLFGYMDNVQKLGLSDNTRITSNDYAIEQIYRLHIIPIRAMLMDCKVTACP